jgi:hypothetical protein
VRCARKRERQTGQQDPHSARREHGPGHRPQSGVRQPAGGAPPRTRGVCDRRYCCGREKRGGPCGK